MRIIRVVSGLLAFGFAHFTVVASFQTVDQPLRETKFDKDLIAGSVGVGASISLSNGRQIVRNKAGSWFVGFDSETGPHLAVARETRSEGRHFETTLDLNQLLGIASAESEGLSMAIDSHDNLHLVWGTEEGLFHSWCFVGEENGYTRVSERAGWKTTLGSGALEKVAEAGARLGDLAVAPDGGLWLAFSRRGSIVVARYEGGWKFAEAAGPLSRWAVVSEPPDHEDYEIRQIEEGCRDPVLEIDGDGTLHLAFAHRWEVYYSQSRDGKRWTARPPKQPRPEIGGWDSPFATAERVAYAHAFSPSMVLVQGRPLVAYQFEGMVDLDPHNPEFMRERWNGVASVGYAYREEAGWRRDYLYKSREIMVKRLPPGEGHWKEGDSNYRKPRMDQWSEVFLADEEQWRPVLGTDRFGIPWAVWNDTTRRYNYFSRWLGEGFDERREWRGAFYGLSKHSTMEKHAPPGSSELGTLVLAADRIYFCRMPVASIDPAQDRYTQVLDLLEFSAAHNIRTGLTQFRRHPSSPIFGSNPDRSAWDGSRVVGGVRYEPETGVYRMFYGGSGPKNWEAEDGDVTNGFNGYAESLDGIHFERKNLGLVEFRGNKENNIYYGIQYFEDPDETDPARRFKGFITNSNKAYLKELGKEGRILYAYSGDSLHWTVAEDITDQAPTSDHGAGPSYKDPYDFPERRYKSTHRAYNLTGRALGMSYSAELLGPWKGFEDVLDYYDPYENPPHIVKVRSGWLIFEAGGGIGEDQVYGGGVRLEDSVYLLQYAPVYFDGRYSTAFAISRDGLNFYRIKNGENSLPPSGAGNWDSGIIQGGAFVDQGDEKWFYYSGSPWHHNTMVRPGGKRALTGGIFGRPEAFVGIATVRNHAWTFAALSDPLVEGTLDTLPIQIGRGSERRLLLNIDGIGDQGQIEVELLDSKTGVPIPGFERSDCRPIAAGLDVPVAWRGGERLSDVHCGQVIIRFYFSGIQSKLHAFRFSD
ncbi:MAG: hypothetical protein DRP71_10505 [Verrucomicrobia bacterium]|nr:MAG: hypothetical protein DRP71_10505 [Verrucomicrobiota bacterium]